MITRFGAPVALLLLLLNSPAGAAHEGVVSVWQPFFIGAAGSSIKNSFISTRDDGIKVYHDMVIENVTVIVIVKVNDYLIQHHYAL